MKPIILHLLFHFAFFFIQCTSGTQDTKLNIANKIAIDSRMNRDTFFIGERCNIEIYLVNHEANNRITSVEFFYNDIYLPHSYDTANATFLIKDLSAYILDTLEYNIKAVFKMNEIVDSVISYPPEQLHS